MKYLLIGLFLISCLTVTAQDHPFYNEIKSFKEQDKIKPPGLHKILFIGSSTFRKWTDVQDYFPGYPIINRGFGGSTLPDIIAYAGDIIYPYQPRQVVIYCGDNDLAASDTVTAETVYKRFIKLFQIIRLRLPNTNILFISIKPSPSRERLMPKMVRTNELIRNFLSKEKNACFVNIYNSMLDNKGKPMEDIFENDKLHMNARGYAIWQKKIKPCLLK